MRTCKIEGCPRDYEAKGFCGLHYRRWRLYGSPLTLKLGPRGDGSVNKRGYRMFLVDGKRVGEHILVATRALGKPLPADACVHHVDENRANNRNDNLVICPDNAYHMALHMRLKALRACGNSDWRRCAHCKTYSDPAGMNRIGPMRIHKDCQRIVRLANKTRRMQNVSHV